MRKAELLIPAGSLEVLKTAVIFGADAVYIGGEAFSLRAKAKNFSPEEMEEGICFAHERGVKVYVTANIFAHNSDLDGVREYFRQGGGRLHRYAEKFLYTENQRGSGQYGGGGFWPLHSLHCR